MPITGYSMRGMLWACYLSSDTESGRDESLVLDGIILFHSRNECKISHHLATFCFGNGGKNVLCRGKSLKKHYIIIEPSQTFSWLEKKGFSMKFLGIDKLLP